MVDNPFVTSGYAGEEFFCDRIEETRTMVELLTNGNNVSLISPRRLGKTDLIRHCFQQQAIRERYHTFVIDIYATNTLRDFVNVFGKAILEELKPKGKKVWETFVQTLRSIRSEISFDVNNNPVWGIGVGVSSTPEVTLDEIFEYLNNADRHCMVAIDEFQQITHYSDNKNIEAALRTHIQRCSNANFVFSGSQRHLMGEMFASPSRPFYQSTTLFNLHAIPFEKYLDFAVAMFSKYGNKTIEREVVEQTYNKFKGVTANIQKIMNILFMKTPYGGHCTTDMVETAINSYIQLASDTYEALLCQMPEKQRNTFMAIASEGKARAVSSATFVKRHHLPSPSSVVSAIRGLLEKDFITFENGEYYVYDLFFQLWLERRGSGS